MAVFGGVTDNKPIRLSCVLVNSSVGTQQPLCCWIYRQGCKKCTFCSSTEAVFINNKEGSTDLCTSDVLSNIAAAVTGPGEMRCGIPSSPKSIQVTSDAYLMKVAEQVHIRTRGAQLSVFYT